MLEHIRNVEAHCQALRARRLVRPGVARRDAFLSDQLPAPAQGVGIHCAPTGGAAACASAAASATSAPAFGGAWAQGRRQWTYRTRSRHRHRGGRDFGCWQCSATGKASRVRRDRGRRHDALPAEPSPGHVYSSPPPAPPKTQVPPAGARGWGAAAKGGKPDGTKNAFAGGLTASPPPVARPS